MKRRAFIAALGGAAAWPVVARAQQPKKVPRIGLLVATNASAWAPRITAFVQRLRQLGWIEGQTVTIEYRWAEGQYDRFAEIAAEFVRLKVDVIVTAATAPVLAAKQATSSIPIVFAVSGDPVGSGLVASLARPGGNVTGLSLQQAEVGSKRLELLREIVPDLRRLAIIANASSPMIVSKCKRSSQRHDRSPSKWLRCKLMDRTTYPAPSRPPVKSRPTPSTFAQTHSRALIEAEYMPPRKALDYRVYPVRRITSTLGLWNPMVRISRTCLGEHPNT